MAKLYLSTDGNAPVLCGQRTSMVNVLRKCLVDGYGTKEPAGWTMPFVNVAETRACFRNNGTGFFLQIDQETPSQVYYVAATAYEMMTSYSAGSNTFGTTTDLTYSISYTAGTTARPWICIATDKYVYFFSYYNTTTMPLSPSSMHASSYYMGFNFFFGDFEKAYWDDGFACAFFKSTWAGGGRHGFGDSTHNAFEGHGIARALSGVVGSFQSSPTMAPPGAFSHSSLNSWNGFGTAGPVYDGQTDLLVSKITLSNGPIHSFRGYMPDMLAPCHPWPFNNLATVEINGESYIVVTWKSINDSGANRTPQAFFKIN